MEGMGGVWDRSADVRRNPDFATGVEEAVVAWSAPQPWHPAAMPFINRALAHAFPNGWAHEFAHTDARVGRVATGNGQVVDRLQRVAPRLPAGFYDVLA